jgi:hypothetical protein
MKILNADSDPPKSLMRRRIGIKHGRKIIFLELENTCFCFLVESVEVGIAVAGPLGAFHHVKLVEWELHTGR